MGGVEDGQPPSKRLRLSCTGSSSLSGGLKAEESVVAVSLRDLMARPMQCQGEEEVIGSRGVIKKLEFVRLIASALYALGYERTGACLEEESGIPLHSASVNLLMHYVLEGRWDESASLLQSIGLEDETIIKAAKFLILEQKFFELLNDDKTMDALKTLRTEISPLHIKTSRVHELSSCILYHHPQCQNGFAHMDSLKVKLRSEVLNELQKLFPPTIMVPARRLENLVEQALNLQRGACIFHNSSDREMSLYADHHCGRDNIPSHTLQILEGHKDEVWFLQFSHKGKYLASASNDRSVIIWEVDASGEVTLKHRLCGHQRPVSHISWSPNDQHLLTCGVEETVRRWDVLSGECLQVYEKAGVPAVSCAWSPDGESVFAGFLDKSICMWDVDGKELECWKGQRTLKISDLAITIDGKKIISMCRDTAILLLDRETKTEKLIEEDQTITSFTLSDDGKCLLVNLINQEIHLWTIDGDIKLLSKYKGHKRSRFIVRSCFGGLEQSFIASGSEDSQVYIWHRSSGQLVDILPGHSGAVNCVSWNPVDHHMLATASDDRTIRIWGLSGAKLKRRVCHSNGIRQCNGKL